MKRTAFLTLVLAGFCLLAADKIQPFSAKLGLWEVTISQQSGAVPGGATLPPGNLSQMTPAERAQMEARLRERGGSPMVRTRQNCVTEESLSRGPFSAEKPNCQRTLIRSTSKLLELHEVCSEGIGSRTVDAKYEIIGDTSMRGSIKVSATKAGHPTVMSQTLTGKWLSADCGTVKN